MTQLAQKIIDEATKLSPLDRAEIIERIMESFDADYADTTEKLWIKEAEDRYSQYKNGAAVTVSADKVFDKINNGEFLLAS